MDDPPLQWTWGFLEKPLVFAFVFILTIAIGNIVYLLLRRWLDPRMPERDSKFVARLVHSALFLAGLYIGLYRVLELDLRALATSLGVLTVAVAFSAQQVGQNLVAGVLVWVRRTVWYEDWVEVGSTGLCRVKDITLLQTVLRHRDGRLITLPNSQLMALPIVNYTRSGFVEVPIEFTLAGHHDPERIISIAMEVADSHPNILPNVAEQERQQNERIFNLPQIRSWIEKETVPTVFAPRVLVESLGDGKITFSARIWIREAQWRDSVISEFLTALHQRLREEAPRS